MIATALAWTWALAATSAPPAAPPTAVRLAPVRCADLPDAAVRAPLRVELGHRLLDDSAPDGPDVLLVSIACNGPDATVLAVRQSEGGAAVRRLVPFSRVALEARPRELAVAAAELIHVADVREASTPSPTVVAVAPAAPPAPSWVLTVSPAVLYWGGYFSNDFLATGGASLRVGVEHGAQWPASPSWHLGLTSDLQVFGGPYQTAYRAGLLGLLQRRGPLFVSELGLGARAGVVSDYPTGSTTTRTAGGPAASLGISLRFLPGLSSDLVAEGGYDFGGPGAWFLPRFGFTLRFW